MALKPLQIRDNATDASTTTRPPGPICDPATNGYIFFSPLVFFLFVAATVVTAINSMHFTAVNGKRYGATRGISANTTHTLFHIVATASYPNFTVPVADLPFHTEATGTEGK